MFHHYQLLRDLVHRIWSTIHGVPAVDNPDFCATLLLCQKHLGWCANGLVGRGVRCYGGSFQVKQYQRDLVGCFAGGLGWLFDPGCFGPGQNLGIGRPMVIQEAKFDGDLWFIFSEDSPKAQQIKDDAEVNVAFESQRTWASLAGHGRIIHDRAKLAGRWSSAVDAWFPEGIKIPGVALLKVEAESVQY